MQNVTRVSIPFALSFAACLVSCERDRESTDATPPRAIQTHMNASQTAENQQASPNANQPSPAQNLSVAGLASCQPSAGVSEVAARLTDLADANEDGKISHEEAQSAMNFIVGGAFFRADANGDGKITPEEGRLARTELTKRYPAIGTLIDQSKTATGESPFRSLARVLDVEYGKTVTLDDARQAVRAATDDIFKSMDRNHDGTITRDEAINAGWDQARKLGAEAFAAADANKDGYIQPGEFQNLVTRSSSPLFNAADTNNDGKLSQDESATAMNTMVQTVGLPEGKATGSDQRTGTQ